MGEAGPQLNKIGRNKEQAQKRILEITWFGFTSTGENKRKYFTSEIRITSIVIFWLTTQNPNTPNLSLTNYTRVLKLLISHTTLSLLRNREEKLKEKIE